MSKPIIISANTQFYFLTVIGMSRTRSKSGKMQVECSCVCGRIITVLSHNLRRGNTKSCGCQKAALIQNYLLQHGAARIGNIAPEYRVYMHAKQRCVNPNDTGFLNYGGRGIEFRFESFAEFIAELGPRPTDQHSVDRIDNNGHYEKGNLKWSTRKEQANNRRPRQKNSERRGSRSLTT